jgi:chitinase
LIVGYVTSSSRFDEVARAAHKLSHINYAFARIKDGRVVDSEGNSQTVESNADPTAAMSRTRENFRALRAIKARHPGLKTLISIGGWGADGFSDAALTEQSRKLFAVSAVEFMKAGGFDGIDMDWEYPSNDMASIKARPDDKHNFTLMLRALRQELTVAAASEQPATKQPYLLTIAAGAGQYYIDGIELPQVAEVVDFINLMTYDFYNGWATLSGHHANLFVSPADPKGDSADSTVLRFMKQGAPRAKLVLGTAFYGRGVRGVTKTNAGLMQQALPKSNFVKSYREITSEMLGKPGWTRYWDDVAKVPYLYNGDTFLSYEDPESIAHKARYVRQHDLLGVMFWESSQDSGALLDTLNQELWN